MGTNRNGQILAIVALVIGVIGLSIGFAAFSRTLTISPSLDVKPTDETFLVRLSSSSYSFATDAIQGLTSGSSHANLTASSATIGDITGSGDDQTNSGLTISNMKATFSEPGQKATYTFYVRNDGNYTAYLKSITFATVEGESSSKVCTSIGGTQSLVNSVCEDISYSIHFGTADDTTATRYTSTTTGLSTELARNDYATVTVTIMYNEKEDNSTQIRADGDFTVEFGSISLNYSTAA